MSENHRKALPTKEVVFSASSCRCLSSTQDTSADGRKEGKKCIFYRIRDRAFIGCPNFETGEDVSLTRVLVLVLFNTRILGLHDFIVRLKNKWKSDSYGMFKITLMQWLDNWLDNRWRDYERERKTEERCKVDGFSRVIKVSKRMWTQSISVQ